MPDINQLREQLHALAIEEARRDERLRAIDKTLVEVQNCIDNTNNTVNSISDMLIAQGAEKAATFAMYKRVGAACFTVLLLVASWFTNLVMQDHEAIIQIQQHLVAGDSTNVASSK